MHAEMFKLQKRAGRIITSSKLEERYSEIRMDKNTIYTEKASISNDIKALGGMTSEYLTQMFHVSDNQNYQPHHSH